MCCEQHLPFLTHELYHLGTNKKENNLYKIGFKMCTTDGKLFLGIMLNEGYTALLDYNNFGIDSYFVERNIMSIINGIIGSKQMTKLYSESNLIDFLLLAKDKDIIDEITIMSPILDARHLTNRISEEEANKLFESMESLFVKSLTLNPVAAKYVNQNLIIYMDMITELIKDVDIQLEEKKNLCTQVISSIIKKIYTENRKLTFNP